MLPRGCALTAVALVGSLAGCLGFFHARMPLGARGGEVGAIYRGPALVLAEKHPETTNVSQIYRVRAGETLWAISRRHGCSVAALARANALDDPRILQPGQPLRIPRCSATGPVSPRAPPRRMAKAQATLSAAKVPVSAKPAVKSFARASTKPKVPVTKAPAHAPPAHASSYPLRWPVEGAITSRFGKREGKPHDGIDIGAPRGTPVKAAATGQVLFSDRHRGYGNVVILRHAGGLITVYAHHDINLVRKGQKVAQGQAIAKVGTSGRTTGPHLHFEVRRGTRPTNPLHFLPP